MFPPTILSDAGRLSQLQSLGVIDTPAEQYFDELTKLVAAALRAPVALINFVDDAKTWCKAAWGAIRENRPNEECLCAKAIEAGDILLIEDAATHALFASHPNVTDERQVRFYAGIVLRLGGGHPIGTLCITDKLAREVEERDIQLLRHFAQQIVKHIEAQQLQQQASSLQERLDNSQRNRDQFLAMLAHELRAPLAPILTAVEILRQPDIGAAQQARAKALIERHARYMSEIVDHLLSASLVSFGAIELKLEPVSLKWLVEQAIELTENLILANHHAFTCTLIDDPWVEADRTQCPLLIANLLNNAAKYTPVHGKIDLTARRSSRGIEVRVRDSGVGIAAEEMDEIFQVFGQSKQPLDRASGGIGLGLALSRRLAEWHGGSLRAESGGRGHGSEFILTLRKAAKPAAVAVAAEIEPLPPLDILIVDDNVDTADALGMYYELAGHLVRIAYCAADALSMMQRRQPDVVLSDIGLPDTNGYELIRTLRQHKPDSTTIFIAVSGYASDKDREQAIAAGFDAHYAKPVDLRTLDSELARLSRRS
jgi:signal transduction histidine kinase/CheY-like chemotaxis protein